MKLKPVLKDIVWGGYRLAGEYGKSDDPNKKIAESWELAAHKNGVNIIENGEHAGKLLSEVWGAEKFPLLIKFIDAKQKLSVQVHPGDDYAKKFEGEFGKTEMWYIVDANPGAQIVYGLNGDYSRRDLQSLINAGKFEDCLNYITVKPGDVYFIPAGLVHAIGAGILIAEIQQNSDTTYRFYDYNRLGDDGKPRELHIQQALDVCIKTKTEYVNPCKGDVLAECEYFKARKIELAGERFEFLPDSFASVICLGGGGEIIYGNEKYTIKKGDSYFIPAGAAFNVTGTLEFILTGV